MRNLLLLVLLVGAGRLAALPAFDFSVTDSDGNQHDLYADYISQGKAVVIELFFTTCPPCNTHAPHFQTLYQSMKTQHAGKVEFFMVTTLGTDTNAKIAQYKTGKGMTMPGVGSDGNSQDVVNDYQSGYFGQYLGTPTFIVIAPYTGEVFFDIRGNSPQNTMTLIANLTTHLVVPAPPSMECSIVTPSGALINDVKLGISAPALDTSFTVQGNYKLSQIPALQTTLPYDVWAGKNTGFLNGVTTFDLVLISKHILGIDVFNADWKRTAADVNLSGTVTTFDIVEIRKLILGIYDTFPVSPSWVFLPDTGWEVNGYCLAFQGIKKGDVNASASFTGSADDRSGPVWYLEAADGFLEAGEETTIRLSMSKPLDLLGLQAVLAFAPDELLLEEITSGQLPGFDRSAWNPGRVETEGLLPFNWFEAQPHHIQADGPLLNIRLKALKAGRLSDLLRFSDTGLAPEAYDRDGNAHPLVLRWHNSGDATIFPNPAHNRFSLLLPEPAEEEVLITLVDLLGRIHYQQSLQAPGKQLDIYPGDIHPGLYWVKMNDLPVGKIQILSR